MYKSNKKKEVFIFLIFSNEYCCSYFVTMIKFLLVFLKEKVLFLRINPLYDNNSRQLCIFHLRSVRQVWRIFLGMELLCFKVPCIFNLFPSAAGAVDF